MVKSRIETLLYSALKQAGIEAKTEFSIDIPRRKEFGDYATNLPILYGRQLSQNPLKVAELLIEKVKELDQENLFSKVELAKPGFINFTLSDPLLQQTVPKIKEEDHDWGKSSKRQK